MENRMKMDGLTYCFDLDNTLCLTNDTTDYTQSVPILKRIDIVNRLFDDGHKIIIDTARDKKWYDITVKQLELWRVKYHTLRVGIKFYADVYVDDKSTNSIMFFNDEQ